MTGVVKEHVKREIKFDSGPVRPPPFLRELEAHLETIRDTAFPVGSFTSEWAARVLESGGSEAERTAARDFLLDKIVNGSDLDRLGVAKALAEHDALCHDEHSSPLVRAFIENLLISPNRQIAGEALRARGLTRLSSDEQSKLSDALVTVFGAAEKLRADPQLGLRAIEILPLNSVAAHYFANILTVPHNRDGIALAHQAVLERLCNEAFEHDRDSCLLQALNCVELQRALAQYGCDDSNPSALRSKALSVLNDIEDSQTLEMLSRFAEQTGDPVLRALALSAAKPGAESSFTERSLSLLQAELAKDDEKINRHVVHLLLIGCRGAQYSFQDQSEITSLIYTPEQLDHNGAVEVIIEALPPKDRAAAIIDAMDRIGRAQEGSDGANLHPNLCAGLICSLPLIESAEDRKRVAEYLAYKLPVVEWEISSEDDAVDLFKEATDFVRANTDTETRACLYQTPGELARISMNLGSVWQEYLVPLDPSINNAERLAVLTAIEQQVFKDSPLTAAMLLGKFQDFSQAAPAQRDELVLLDRLAGYRRILWGAWLLPKDPFVTDSMRKEMVRLLRSSGSPLAQQTLASMAPTKYDL